MRKLYNEFFYIPKHGKVREKVMLTRIAMTVTIVIMCLAAMSITAYAYFSYNITSGSNIIKAASFYTDVMVQITAEDGAAVNTITTNTSDHKSHSAELTANKTYTITVKHNDRSTAQTGFVIVTAEGCETKYHTQQLGRDGDGNTYTITFKLTPGANTDVTFRSHWGTSSYYGYAGDSDNNIEEYILDGEEIKMTIDGVAPSSNKGGTENHSGDGSESNTSENTNTTPSTNTTTGTESSSTQTPESTTTPSTETSTPVVTTPPETTGTSESTGTTEPSTTTTEPTTTQPAETTEQPQSVTENTETTGAPTTEANS